VASGSDASTGDGTGRGLRANVRAARRRGAAPDGRYG
jgi:hypothetical protein